MAGDGGLITVGSLFAGIGGIELGLERTGGFRTVWQVENDIYATRVLARHWPDVRRWGDVRTFPPDASQQPIVNVRGDGRNLCQAGEGGRGQESSEGSNEDWYVDLICGGFPCQDISYAGRGAGLAGDRSGLWYEFARIIRTLRPRYVLVENVAALLTRGVGDVLGTLASLGYDAEWHCIPAAAVGAPHIRDRVFVVGYAASTQTGTDATGRGPRGAVGESGGEVANANRQPTNGATVPRGQCNHWSTESDVGRVAHGVPSRVDRLRCLGNAVVPQVAEWIGRRILEEQDGGRDGR